MIFDYTPFFSGAYIDWSKNALAKAQKIFPNVNPNGLNWYEEYQTESDLWKESDWAMICICREYLLKAKRVKKPSYSSYSLKHRIEQYYTVNNRSTYVHNGACIVAAIGCDISYRQFNRLSLCLAVSQAHALKRGTETQELSQNTFFDL